MKTGGFIPAAARCGWRWRYPPEGSVVVCDVSEKRIATGWCYREEAGVSDRVDLQLAAALEMLDRLLAADQEGSFDFAFIDAGKENQLDDYQRTRQDPGACAIRALNQHVHTDSRVYPGRLWKGRFEPEVHAVLPLMCMISPAACKTPWNSAGSCTTPFSVSAGLTCHPTQNHVP
jgi:hypothetical protein